jgi:hypothetical protein
MHPIRALVTDLIDYAGLFPPAKLEMEAAVRSFVEYRRGAHAWMLGRFVVPAARLEEFERALAAFPAHAGESPLALSVLSSAADDGEIERVQAWGEHHVGSGPRVASLEIRVTHEKEMIAALERVPDGVETYFEIPLGSDTERFLDDLAGTRGRAKVRTGGVTPEAFPTLEEVDRFLVACRDRRVPFKATAGLHHALRGNYALTYEEDSSQGPMHGFLNLFLAAALLHAGRIDAQSCLALLDERDPEAFAASEHSAGWRGFALSASEIARARRELAISYGSCSFLEPLEELEHLELL